MTVLLILGLTVTIFPAFVATSKAADSDWTLIYDGRGVKAYPNLREYVWQKNATMEPHGIYDKIGLHRLVKTGITPKGVVFICAWGSGSGQLLASNPPTDNVTRNENATCALYWANRDFDVYAIDYRSHFVPQNLNASELSFTADWGWDQWISDMKEAVNEAKEVSGAKKIFMAGIGQGGENVMNYATLYWKEDIRGIVLIAPSQEGYGPGAPIWARIGGETNTYNLTAKLANMVSTMSYSTRLASYDVWLPWFKYAFDNPGGAAINPTTGTPLPPAINPATSKPWSNITEYVTWFVLTYMSTLYNVKDGYGNMTNIIYTFVKFEGGPNRLVLEDQAMIDWTNCPYVTHDFDDHYSEIDVPLLAFADELETNSTGKLRFVNGINNTDFTAIMLQKYGHGDVHCGVYAARDVFQPALDWMRSELVGLKATAFSDVTVLPGWTWWFFAHSTGGTGSHTYQWYEGTTLLQGQTSMVLPVTKNTPGTYTFYCKVTDSQGATTNSNTIRLTVRG